MPVARDCGTTHSLWAKILQIVVSEPSQSRKSLLSTLWFQLIVTPQGIEKITIQLKDAPTKVYAIGAKLF